MQRRGSVLVLALWALVFLSTLATTLAMKIRSDISLLSRVEKRNRLMVMATSGVRKAIAILHDDIKLHGQGYTPDGKAVRHNNEVAFKNIRLGEGLSCDVVYEEAAKPEEGKAVYYGLVDEERKINLNTADSRTLTILLERALGWEEEKAKPLAIALTDWRAPVGKEELTGFYSDEYYETLEYPYEPKKADFENMEEILLVEGMNEALLRMIAPIVTVYGDGKINVNTASEPVLVAAGLPEEIALQLIILRRGVDGQEATPDDLVFGNIQDIVVKIKGAMRLTAQEDQQLNEAVASGKFGTQSFFYTIQSRSARDNDTMHSVITCLFNTRDNKISFWKEIYESSL